MDLALRRHGLARGGAFAEAPREGLGAAGCLAAARGRVAPGSSCDEGATLTRVTAGEALRVRVGRGALGAAGLGVTATARMRSFDCAR